MYIYKNYPHISHYLKHFYGDDSVKAFVCGEVVSVGGDALQSIGHAHLQPLGLDVMSLRAGIGNTGHVTAGVVL